MASSRSHSFTVTFRVVLALPDVGEIPTEPVLTEQSLADPDTSVDAAMDHLLPREASSEVLRQAQRCLLAYIGWLMDDAPARHPSWAKDELQRALRRLVEVQMALRVASHRLH
jgi:hypothetical protein